MSKGTEGHFDTLPIGRLGLIPLNSSAALGKKVDDYLVSWRKGRGNEFAEKYVAAYEGYERDSYIIQSQVPRFGSGEAKGIINESVRGDDIYILLDVCNYSLTYSLCGYTNHMSPDDHFQDLKRVIAAIGGKARRINVIMPFLYESRQHKRSGRESLDCALGLQELTAMGVENIRASRPRFCTTLTTRVSRTRFRCMDLKPSSRLTSSSKTSCAMHRI